ncbi:MAG: hypothetical protein ACXWIU_13415 [Limisphaerales bacterium]
MTVAPGGFENTAGGSGDAILFAQSQMQQLFRASSLAQQWSTPVEITGLAFRNADKQLDYSSTIAQVEIRFSTSSRTPEQLTPFYFNNVGADETTVYLHQNVSLFAAVGNPAPFDLKFQFDKPFVYDPNNGSLLMYIQTIQPSGGANTIDSHVFGDLNVSPVAYTGTSGPFASGIVAPYGIITEFTWVAIPEPNPGYLLICGVGIVFSFARLRKQI